MPLTAGDRLGPYEIVALIGGGGQGVVYRARDIRLDREVAVKVVPGRLRNDPQSPARFERETKAVAALSHQNIVALYDVGRDSGVLYAVTELLEGETLRSSLRRGPLGWRNALRIGAAVADGLAEAHSRGIIHRDLKPENIFLTSGGGVKILDFGLARRGLPTAPGDETATLTETEPGTILGTVGYMSPEQVRGGLVDAPSDIFSLGCVLYEMVAGKRPFACETPVQTMASILEHDPLPLTDLTQQVPPSVEHTIARCLAKRVPDRLQSARDLSFALHDAIREGDASRLRNPHRRLRRVTWIGAAAVLLVAAGISWFMMRAKPVESLAILPFVNASNPDLDYLSEGITESLINGLSQVGNLAVMSRNSVFRFKGQETDAQAVGRALKVETVLTGRVARLGESLSISAELIEVSSNHVLWGERYHRRLADLFALQEEISTEISNKLRLKLRGDERRRLAKRPTQNSEAYQLYLRGRYQWNKRTADGFRKGIDYFQKALAGCGKTWSETRYA
jgi:serine/threonine protein kinase